MRFVGLLGCIALLAFAGFATGCPGEDDDPHRPGPTGPSTDLDAGDDADVDDPEDTEEDTDVDDPPDDSCGGECDDGEICQDDECIEVGDGISCDNPIEIDLDSEGTTLETVHPQNEPNLIESDCYHDDVPRVAFHLSGDAVASVNAQIVATDFPQTFEMDIRQGQCEFHSSRLDPNNACRGDGQTSWVAEPGIDNFLLVGTPEEPPTASFDIEFDVQHLECMPGERSCDGDDRLFCAGGTEERSYPCFDGCAGGDCVGDTCSNPVEVTASRTFNVEMDSLRNTIDFSDSPSCSSLGAEGPTTNGRDLVFSIPDIAAGQVIEATSPGGHFRIGLMEPNECNESAPECIAANSTGGHLSWEATAHGDYYVVINRASMTEDEIAEFSIDILD